MGTHVSARAFVAEAENAEMRIRVSDLWTWQGSIGRGEYFFWGFVLCAIKYNIDRLLVWNWSGQRWSLIDYTKVGEYLWPRFPSFHGVGEFATMLALSLPFMTAGVLLTLKRLRSVQFSPWLVLLFFVPVIKLILFVLLSLLPPREKLVWEEVSAGGPKAWLGILIPRGGAAAGLAGIVFATASSAICVWLGTTVLRQYGWSLFVGLPFALGFLSVLVFGYHERRSFWTCMAVSMLAVLAAGAGLIVVAIEGAVCLIMAVPLAAPMAFIGGCVAYQIQRRDWWHGRPTEVFCVALLAPLLMLLEHVHPAPLPLLSVTSSVEVAAPPEKVWRNVVSFSDLPPPHEFLFRVGIAYPIRARIQGTGAGAERLCEFSTGPFVEPIEIWDEPHLLKFSVTKNPAPMQEWTPYADLHPAHLDGFLESRAGQFRLVPIEGDRTRLEGTTWYFHHMWPVTYWSWWSDYIIHKIHLRVLRHVKQLSEEA
jgi:uncharacterized membrane protein YhaH (DUF805 family)